MSQNERLNFLIDKLLKENKKYNSVEIPKSFEEKKLLFRSLINIRMPKEIDKEFLKIQDEFLFIENSNKGIIDWKDLKTIEKEFPNSKNPFMNKISIWQGDITRLKIDAIVNAANSQLLGCFVPCHRCIDNAIHSAAGIELRNECAEIMDNQGFEEPTGKAKITKAYNLPCKHVIHTVGPTVYGELNETHKRELKSSYLSCLECAVENKLRTIAFCCISTGEYRFPNKEAAEIAFETVTEFLKENHDKIDIVVFNVFKDLDYRIYIDLVSEKS